MAKVILEGENITKVFSNAGNKTMVLNDVNIQIHENDFTIIMGASGAGKSTLLYALSGMDSITSGKIEYKGKEINNLSEKKMANLRTNEFGFIFQQTYLVSNLTLFENIVVSGYLKKGKSALEVQKQANDLLKYMNVEKAKNRLPTESSGGELQRAAVARAIINNPGLLFADEPTGALNKANSEEVLNLLSSLNENGQSILMVTHDVHAALRGNVLIYVEDGKIMGEKKLVSYNGTNIKQREKEINTWLSEMRW